MNPKQSLITSLTCQSKQAMNNNQNTIQPTKNKKSQLKIQIEIQIENLKQQQPILEAELKEKEEK